MKLDTNGYKYLHLREGLKLKPYLDTQGVPTIAMGNTYYVGGKKVTMKDRALTILEAENLSKIIADDFANDVNLAVKSKVNQNQFNALVSIAYNIGINGFKTSTFLKLVNKNPNDPKIAEAIMMWIKNKELIGRRKSEVKQYFLAQ
jgi:lysozyme